MVRTEIFKILKQVFQTFPDVEIVILFGSAVKGRLTRKSDIDIAFAKKTATSHEEKTDIYAALEKSLGREIDLIDLHRINGHILKNILCQGDVLIKKSVPLLAFFYKKMWYNQSDMMPKTRMILNQQVNRFVNG